MAYQVAELSQDDEQKLKSMEQSFSSDVNQSIILIAYKDK